MHTIWYRISSQDTILEVNEGWRAFAVENGVSHLGSSEVLGQPLWRFISGLEIRHLYALLLTRVRHAQDPLVLPLRCDAPAARRFMEMTMTALPDGEVEFATRLVRGVNPTLVSLGAIRRKNGQMKELSDDLLHHRNAQKPCRWLSHAHSDPKMKENWGTFHETAKVVNSLFGETRRIVEFGSTNCQLEFERCQNWQ